MDDDLERCIRQQYRRLVGAVSIVTGSTELAEEAVQEAFARAWERSGRGEHFDHLAGWVATVALNLARSGRRRAASEIRMIERLRAVPPAAPPQHAIEQMVVVRSAVSSLPGRQRDAVVLFYLLDVDVAGVAALLGVSEGTVKTALARAREKLASSLAQPELET